MHSHARPVRRRQVLGGAVALLAGGATSLLHLPLVAATPPPVSFTITNYPTGAGPYGMARGDLNGNGFQDIVIVNFTDGTITILLNHGNGVLTPATNSPLKIPGGDGGFRIGTGYFDNTGKPAIVIVGFQHLTIFPNNTIAGSSTIALGTGVVANIGSVSAFAIGDVNGDGIQDIACALVAPSPPAPTNTGTITMLFGKGNGTFSVGPSFPVPVVAHSLALHDLNGDGLPELIASNTASTTRQDQLFVWNPTTSGGWAPAAGSPYTTSPYSGPAAIGILGTGQQPVIAVSCINTGPGGNVLDILQVRGLYYNPLLNEWNDSPLPTGDGSAGGVAFVDLNGGGPSPCVAGSKSVIIHTPNTMGGFNPYVSVVNPSILNAFAVLALSVGTTGKSDLAVLNYDTNTLTLLQNTTAYTPPFKIFRIPPNGPKRGGYPVDITGVGFREGDRVFFGNRQAFIVRVLDGETIECIPPDASDAQNPDFRVIIKVVHSDNSATAISPGVYEYQDRWGAVPVDPNGPPASEPMGRPGGITGGPPPPAPPGRHAVGGSGGNVPAAPPQPAPVPQRR